MDNTMIPELRAIMNEFIRADERRVVLQRPTFEETSTGGYRKGAFTPLAEQGFRMVPYKRRLTDLVKVKDEGEIPNIAYVLVARWNADVQRMDEFTLDGGYYRIQGLEPHTNERTTTDRVVAQVIVLDEEGVEWLAG